MMGDVPATRPVSDHSLMLLNNVSAVENSRIFSSESDTFPEMGSAKGLGCIRDVAARKDRQHTWEYVDNCLGIERSDGYERIRLTRPNGDAELIGQLLFNVDQDLPQDVGSTERVRSRKPLVEAADGRSKKDVEALRTYALGLDCRAAYITEGFKELLNVSDGRRRAVGSLRLESLVSGLLVFTHVVKNLRVLVCHIVQNLVLDDDIRMCVAWLNHWAVMNLDRDAERRGWVGKCRN